MSLPRPPPSVPLAEQQDKLETQKVPTVAGDAKGFVTAVQPARVEIRYRARVEGSGSGLRVLEYRAYLGGGGGGGLQGLG